MKSKMDTRRENLRHLADQWGGPTGIAKQIGWAGPSYVSQLTNGHRPITEKTARLVEEKLRLDQGWLDQEHELPRGVANVDESMVMQVMKAVGAALQEAGVSIGPRKMAQLVEVLYEDAARSGAVDREKVRRMVLLLKEE
jgi:hypothetical protein